MLRTRSRSIDINDSSSRFKGEHYLAKRFSWRTNLLCGIYSQELTSSIFYTMENDEEVYLRQQPRAREEGRGMTRKPGGGDSVAVISGSKERGVRSTAEPAAPAAPQTATVRHVRLLGKSRRWSLAHRSVNHGIKTFQRRLHRQVSGSMDDIQPKETKEPARRMRRKASCRARAPGEEGVVLCEALAIKDVHPSPYDRQALAFRKGDRIEVVKMGPTGIWRGRCQGREGNFKFIDVRTEKLEPPRSRDTSLVSKRIPRSQSVSDLLSAMSLENLTSVFVLNGYDTAEDIEQLCEEDLEYLGIGEGDTRELLLDTARNLARGDSKLFFRDPLASSSSIAASSTSTATSSASIASSPTEESASSSVQSSFLHGSTYSYAGSAICIADV